MSKDRVVESPGSRILAGLSDREILARKLRMQGSGEAAGPARGS